MPLQMHKRCANLWIYLWIFFAATAERLISLNRCFLSNYIYISVYYVQIDWFALNRNIINLTIRICHWWMHFGLHSRCLFRADNMNIVCLSGALALALALARRHTMTGIFDLPRSHWKWSANIWNLSNGKQCTIEVDNFFHSAVYDVLEWLFNIWWSNAVLRMVMRMTATSVHRDKQIQKLNAWIIFFTKCSKEKKWNGQLRTEQPNR